MNRIIFAMKIMNENEALSIAEKLSGKVWGFKLNSMLFGNLSLIKKLKQFGNVMADAKVYEIPEDMENSVRVLVDAGADIVTVHCSPLWKAPDYLVDKVVGVTILTSFDDEKCSSVYGRTVNEQIYWMVEQVFNLNYKMIVCSALDLRSLELRKLIRKTGIKPICPSIRLSDQIIHGDDQVRKATPSEAINFGAELIVVGRPILQASDPISVVDKINMEINDGLL